MDALFGGQTSNQASSNNVNAINAAAGNEQQATNNALQFLSQWLGLNPSPVSKFGNITPPPQFGSGQTIGGGATNSLGALTQAPAVGNTSIQPTMPNMNRPPGQNPIPPGTPLHRVPTPRDPRLPPPILGGGLIPRY